MVDLREAIVCYQYNRIAAALRFIHDLLLTFGYTGTYQYCSTFRLL